MSFYWKEFTEDINNNVKEGTLVFDAGAGDGHWEKNLKQGINYVSMDLGVGDSKVDYSHLDIKGDLRNIPLDGNAVDVIICIQVLEHLPEPWKVLKEFNRILKQGGLIYASCPQGEPQHQIPYDFFRYTIFGLESIFKGNGFIIEWIKPQKGNFSKIANDLRHSGNLMISSKRSKLNGWLLKGLARLVEKFFKPLDEEFTTNTIGHFIKAKKQ
jgi:ubiquinone/menaquinone biosynthesis C-methylase UbiE